MWTSFAAGEFVQSERGNQKKSTRETHLVCTGHLVDSLIHRQQERVALVELVAELVLRARDGALIRRKLTLDCTQAIPSRVELLLCVAESLSRVGIVNTIATQHSKANPPWSSLRACRKGQCEPAALPQAAPTIPCSPRPVRARTSVKREPPESEHSQHAPYSPSGDPSRARRQSAPPTRSGSSPRPRAPAPSPA
jgi:hypothetical protein